MRIDLFSRSIDYAESAASAVRSSKGAASAKQTSGAGAELSLGVNARGLEAKLAEIPEMREERVAALKLQIQQQQYGVKPEQTAHAMFADWSGQG
jgi:anti-sigma28 factor (negative regulator of flagellin synthesis)